MKELKNMIISNYKTAIPGMLTVLCVGLYFFDVIDGTQFTMGTGLLIGAGLIGAKDAKKNEG